MITLCPTTFEVASKMKNFSGWVRARLLEEQNTRIQTENELTRYRCPACWKVFTNKFEYEKMYCMNKDCGYSKELEEL